MEHLRTNQRTKKVYLINQICSTYLYIKLLQSFDLINLSALLQLKVKLMNDLISSLGFAKKLRRSWENNIWLTGPAYSNKSSNIQIAHCRSVGGLAGTWIKHAEMNKKERTSNIKLQTGLLVPNLVKIKPFNQAFWNSCIRIPEIINTWEHEYEITMRVVESSTFSQLILIFCLSG